MCPKDMDAPAWKTLMQVANARCHEWTGVTLYAFSTILWMARHKKQQKKKTQKTWTAYIQCRE